MRVSTGEKKTRRAVTKNILDIEIITSYALQNKKILDAIVRHEKESKRRRYISYNISK